MTETGISISEGKLTYIFTLIATWYHVHCAALRTR